MPTAVELAIDFSQWGGSADVVSPEQVEAWAQRGITKVIIGMGYKGPAIQQIQACYDGGMAVDVYRYLFWMDDVNDQIAYTLDIIAGASRPIGRVWLDVEDSTHLEGANPVDLDVVSLLAEAESRTGIMGAGIYTSRHKWAQLTGNSGEFSHLPLWDADYSADTIDEFTPYGGWTKRVMWQKNGGCDIAGRNVDLNEYRV